MAREHDSGEQEIVSDQHLIDVINTGRERSLGGRFLDLIERAGDHPIVSSVASAVVCAGAGVLVESVRPHKK